MGFLSFLLGRDTMGHALTINYKSEGDYHTLLGALLSISIQIFTLIQCIQLAMSLIEMSDPTVQSYKRSMYQSELNTFGSMNLKENFFNFGLVVT